MQAEPTKARVERKLSLDPADDSDWLRLVDMLPADLEEKAGRTRAIVRRRCIDGALTLLRAILIYVLCSFSLRDTASWMARALDVRLSDDSLGDRFVNAVPFMQQIVEAMLADCVREGSTTGIALRLIDASTLTMDGGKGTDWRVHVTFDPTRGRIVGLELTDAHGGEHVRRAAAGHGDLIIGDMGYGHASDVREAKKQGTHSLFRAHLQNLAVDDLEGERKSPEQLLDAADADGLLDADVLLPEKGHEAVRARLVVLPLPPEQAGRARQKLRKAKKGGEPSALALRHAGYFCCTTSLTREQAPAKTLAIWYRVRWQVELLFKRLKSLMHLKHLPKARPALAELRIWGVLLVAILVEKMASATRSAQTIAADEPPVSLWRLDHLHWLDVVLAVYGGTSLAHRLAEAEATAERLRERPRRKRTWSEKLIATINDALRAISPAPG